jgi:hypothetical protein
MLLTQTQLKSILLDNFNDIRIAAISFYMNRLISRVTFGGGIEQYRIYNTVTDSYITDLPSFLNAIDEAHIHANYAYSTEEHSVEKTHPIQVTLTNLIVKLDNHATDDSYYHSLVGYNTAGNKLTFTINYLSDGDDVLPLKIINIKLT